MKAYLFDLDGTLLDSTGVWAQIDAIFLAKRGFEVPSDYFEAISAFSFQESARYTIDRFGLNESVEELIEEWYGMAEHAYGNTIQMKPTARDYLSRLVDRKVPMAVVTGQSERLYAPALRSHGITGWFNAVCSTDEVSYGKNKPDVYLLAAQRLQVMPQDCIVFEDILEGIQSAKSVGMKVCAVYDQASAHNWARAQAIADWAIQDFAQAPFIK